MKIIRKLKSLTIISGFLSLIITLITGEGFLSLWLGIAIFLLIMYLTIKILSWLLTNIETFFYPGGIWKKRLGHVLVVFMIGANLFLNEIQDVVIDRIDYHRIEIAKATNELDLGKQKMRRVEGWQENLGVSALNYWLGTPSATELNAVIDHANNGIDKVDKIKGSLGDINTGIKVAILIVKWTSIFMWIPIFISTLWLFFDIKKGKARRIVISLVLLSIPFNYYVYNSLHYYVAMIF